MTKTERERLQEIACDICHQPYACANEDELAKACEECPISAEMCEMEEDEPMKRGKWLPFLPEYGDMFKCSVCGIIIRLPIKIKQKPMPYRFCPKCGADMRPTSMSLTKEGEV